MKSVLRDRDGFKDRSYDRYLDADQLREVMQLQQQQQQHQQQQQQEDEHASGRRIGLDADVDVGAALTQTVSSVTDGIKDVVDIGDNDDNDDDNDDSQSFVLSNDGLRNDGNAAVIANGNGMTTVGSHDDIDDDGMEEGKLSTLVRAHLLEVETGSASSPSSSLSSSSSIIVTIVSSSSARSRDKQSALLDGREVFEGKLYIIYSHLI